MEAVAAVPGMTQIGNSGEDLPETQQAQRRLPGFRGQAYRYLTVWADELFEQADACCARAGRCWTWPGCRPWPGRYRAAAPGSGVPPLPTWPDGQIRLAWPLADLPTVVCPAALQQGVLPDAGTQAARHARPPRQHGTPPRYAGQATSTAAALTGDGGAEAARHRADGGVGSDSPQAV